MTDHLRITFDLVDPGSWLVFCRVRKGVNTEVEWDPLELRLPEQAPQDPNEPEWRGMTGGLALEASDLGIPIRIPDFIPHTRKAHELALHAREEGCFMEVLEALFEAHFVTGLDLGRVDALVEIARSAGLDAAEVRTVLGVDRHLPQVEELRATALGRGIRGVPTLEWITGDGAGDRLEGYPGHETLDAFLDRAPIDQPSSPST